MKATVARLLALAAIAGAAACTAILGATNVPDPQDGSAAGMDSTITGDEERGASDAGSDAAMQGDAPGPLTCSPGAARCTGLQPQVCDAGQWVPQGDGAACACGCSAGACDTSYVAEVKCDHPLSYWRLDEPSGSTTAVDQMGNFPGTYFGNVEYAQKGALKSDGDTCVHLNSGSTQTGYIGVSQTLSAMLEFNGQSGRAPFSLEAWIYPTSITNEYRGVFSNELMGDAGKEGYVVYVGGFTSNGTGIGFERYDNGSSTVVQDAGAVTQNVGWYYVVAEYDGTTMSLFVNGQPAASMASSIAIQSFVCTFDIGATHCGAPNTNYQGMIDEVAVYGTALPLPRIQAHYQAAQ